MKASKAVAKLLFNHGIEYCFELAGGMIAHLLDDLSSEESIGMISMHHEQSAAFAAEGVARSSQGRRMAVAMGTSGPGATNLMTGIGSCWFDSVPCLFITGQVNTNELRDSGSLLRQQGFQELDIVPMVKSITKYSSQIRSVNDLMPEIHRAMSIALSGRQGPVLIDIPNNIQRMEIDEAVVDKWLKLPLAIEPMTILSGKSLDLLGSYCSESKRPLICVGGGARWAPSFQTWLDRLNTYEIPYVSTLMSHERIVSNKSYFNMIGSYGNREANWALQNCDLLIVVGARLDVRQTGADVRDFARNAKLIHIDIDPAQLNNRVASDVSIIASSEDFFNKFTIDESVFPKKSVEWFDCLSSFKESLSEKDEYPDWEMSPTKLFSKINDSMAGKAVNYVCDVGNHQMWAAHNLRIGRDQAVHYSGGMGAMGFALPAAIGIALGSNTKVVVITGDGSLQLNIQELDSIKRLGLNISIIVLNNKSLGMVKNFQDMYFEGRDKSTRSGYSAPSFSRLAECYGIEGIFVDSIDAFNASISKVLSADQPILMEVMMPYALECRPRLSYGSKLDEQTPVIIP